MMVKKLKKKLNIVKLMIQILKMNNLNMAPSKLKLDKTGKLGENNQILDYFYSDKKLII